jgi:hypothetical protein
MTPSGISPVVTSRQRAMSSFRANATTIVLRVPPRPSAVRAKNHRASALSFWNWRKRHANRITMWRTRALPVRARPFSPPAFAALVRRSGQPAVPPLIPRAPRSSFAAPRSRTGILASTISVPRLWFPSPRASPVAALEARRTRLVARPKNDIYATGFGGPLH